jgi:HEAT repeat protein
LRFKIQFLLFLATLSAFCEALKLYSLPEENLLYRFRYRSSANYDFSKVFAGMEKDKAVIMPGANGSIFTTISGEISYLPIEFTENHTILFCELKIQYLHLSLNDRESKSDTERIKSDLEKPFFLITDKQGKFLSLEVEKDVLELSDSYLRTLLAMFQFVLPKKGKTLNWETIECDPTGLYVANYKTIKGAVKNTISFSKHKVKYLKEKIDEDETTLTPTVIPKGETIFVLDLKKGNIISLKGEEEGMMYIGGKKVGDFKNGVILELEKEEVFGKEGISEIANLYHSTSSQREKFSLFKTPSREESERVIYRKILGEATLESLLEELKVREGKGEDIIPVYLKLKALIYLKPEVCDELKGILNREDLSISSKKVIADALASVGNTEAQRLILSLIRFHQNDTALLIPLLYSLFDIKKPIPETIETLREFAFNCSNRELNAPARLILGVMANRLKDSSPDTSAEIVDELSKHLLSASSEEEISQLLLALGNAGSERALPLLIDFSRHQSGEIRSCAVRAMRFIKNEKAEEVLLKALISDKEESVRRESAIALSYRKVTPRSFEVQKRVLLECEDVSLRLQLLSNLWESRDIFPSVKGLVERLAKGDKQEEIREAARKLISKE